jgi:hypothetical protein
LLTLLFHMIIHIIEKPYGREVLLTLLFHMIIHIIEKPYSHDTYE